MIHTDRLKDKVALITGASSGIGWVTAEKLHALGMRCALVARRRQRLEELADKLGKDRAHVIEADLSDAAAAETVVQQTLDHFGQIDLLVNNAGVMYLGPVDDADLNDWQQMLAINAMGLMAMARAVLPHMMQRKDGHIINISSTLGREAYEISAAYSMTKFGVVGFSEGLRRECRPHHIRVSIIEPGATRTELHGNVRDTRVKDWLDSRMNEMTTLEAEDVAETIAFAAALPPRAMAYEITLRPTEQP